MATLKETTIDPIDYSPIMAALRKARAGWWLIDAVEHGTRWSNQARRFHADFYGFFTGFSYKQE
jgi:hypothetical protein